MPKIQKTIRLFSVILITTLGLYASAQSGCYPADKAQMYNQDFKISTFSFDSQDLCQTGSTLVKLYQTLDFIHDTEIADTKQPPLVRGILPTNYYEYLRKHVSSLWGPFRRCPTGPESMACLDGNTGMMMVQAPAFDHDIIFLASTLIHEARHADGPFGHVTCEQGNEINADGSCDPDWNQDSTYAVQVEYLARIFLFAKNVTDAQRIGAKGLALYLAQNKFNHSAPQGRKAVALVANDGSLLLYDGKDTQAFDIKVGDADLFSRDRNFNVLPKDRQSSYLFDPYMPHLPSGNDLNAVDMIGRLFVDFNNSWTPEQKQSLVDAYRFANSGEQAVLFGDRLEVINPAGQTTRVDLGFTKITRLVRDVPCSNVSPAVINGLSADGQLWSLQDTAFVATECHWPSGVKDYASLDDNALALLEDGSLAEIKEGKMTPLTSFASKKFRQMLRLKEPFYWGMRADH